MFWTERGTCCLTMSLHTLYRSLVFLLVSPLVPTTSCRKVPPNLVVLANMWNPRWTISHHVSFHVFPPHTIVWLCWHQCLCMKISKGSMKMPSIAIIIWQILGIDVVLSMIEGMVYITKLTNRPRKWWEKTHDQWVMPLVMVMWVD